MEDPIQVETLQEPATGQPQPSFQPEAALTEQAVREAVMRAEAAGVDPTDLPVSAASVQGEAPLEVPGKFKTPTGEVDVEKLKTSTQQLDAAIQAKEQGIQKTVEDYVREYRAKEQKFRSMPNPERLANQLPPAPEAPIQPNDQQLRELLTRDYQADPIATTARLIEIAIEQRLQPYEAERKDNGLRKNVEQLAVKDPRVLQPEVFAAINAKLESDPDLWKLKNPHKAAWLEVKEELRLGEPATVQARPSKPASPILGGGTPPPAPSGSDGLVTHQTLAAAIQQVNPKDKSQMSALDKAAKEYFDRAFRR